MSVIINPGGVGGSAPNSYTVATLPSAPIGTMAVVTDGAPSQAWASVITGGGTARYLVWFNGAHWTVVGDGGYAPVGGYIPLYPYYGYG
jgi:hypothetical protein